LKISRIIASEGKFTRKINRFLVSSTEKNQAIASSFQRSGPFIKEINLEKAQEPDAVKK
jgi:hypothetical protein